MAGRGGGQAGRNPEIPDLTLTPLQTKGRMGKLRNKRFRLNLFVKPLIATSLRETEGAPKPKAKEAKAWRSKHLLATRLDSLPK